MDWSSATDGGPPVREPCTRAVGGGLMVTAMADETEMDRDRVSTAECRGEYGGGGVSRVAVEVLP